MASDYNSQLSSDLYKSFQFDNPDKARDIVLEMQEIGTVDFIYQICDAYKRYKNTYSSHYFISALGTCRSPVILKVILELISDPELSDTNFFWMLDILISFSYTSAEVVKRAISIIIELASSPNYNLLYFNFESALSYIELCKESDKIYRLLLNFIIDEKYESDLRTTALHHFIKINPPQSFTDLITLFGATSSPQLQVMYAKESIRWKDGKAEDFHQYIIKNGNSRAVEIVSKYLEVRNEAIEKKKASAISEESDHDFRNIVKEIYDLRIEINRLIIANTGLLTGIFQDREDLLTQIWSATTENDLKNKCQSIRDQILKLSSEVALHGIGENERLALCKQYDEYIDKESVNKSLNQLYIFLRAKEIADDYQLFGLRKLNRICSLLGSHAQGQLTDLVKLLKEFGLYSKYEKKEWSNIHLFLLSEYKKSLVTFKQILVKKYNL